LVHFAFVLTKRSKSRTDHELIRVRRADVWDRPSEVRFSRLAGFDTAVLAGRIEVDPQEVDRNTVG
jgi:hypothetical protein